MMRREGANGRNRNKATTPRPEPTSRPDQAQWPHLNLLPTSRPHRTSATPILPPPTAPSWQRPPKWISCPINTILPSYTPFHPVHSSASTCSSVCIHGPVLYSLVRPNAGSLLLTTRSVRKDSIRLSDFFLGRTSPRLPSKRL
jgi:hypothetical protein